MELCKKIVDELQKQIESFKEKEKEKEKGFYDTFDFTVTGNNETHPRTIGLLCKILWEIETIAAVYVDMRFNDLKGKKFQPDLTGIGVDGKPIIYIDYESPNSSDARVIEKDVDSYKSWIKSSAPYIIITTLPDRKALDWKVKWTARGQWNYLFREDKSKSKIKKNPFRFWYSYYRKHVKGKDTRNIFFANINGKTVNLIEM